MAERKTKQANPQTFRFSPEELATMDELSRALALPGAKPLPRIDILRAGLHLLAGQHLGRQGRKKTSEKSAESA